MSAGALFRPGMRAYFIPLAADVDEKEEAITLLNAYVHYIPVDIHAKT